MQIWRDSKNAFQEKQGRGKAIWKISRLYWVFSIEGFPYSGQANIHGLTSVHYYTAQL